MCDTSGSTSTTVNVKLTVEEASKVMIGNLKVSLAWILAADEKGVAIIRRASNACTMATD